MSPGDDGEGQVSPDGRWLAYMSNQSGTPQIYVQPFTPGGVDSTSGRWQVSSGGGNGPRWRQDGRELFYRGSQGVMAVDVKAGSSFETGTPRQLFPYRFAAASCRSMSRPTASAS